MKKNFFTLLLTLIIIIQPILDLYFISENPSFEFFGFKYTTIIRYGLILLMGLLLIWQTKLKKWRTGIIVYSLLLIIYIILHCINCRSFNSINPNLISFNVLEELLYIARYMIPLFLIYYLNTTEIQEEKLKKVFIFYCLGISLSSIISNIFYIARTTYYSGVVYTNTYNVFDWFTKNINYLHSASKGFFTSTSAITTLLLVTPYMFYQYYKNGKIIYLIVLACNMLALFIVGTRACAYGFIIISALMLIMYVFFAFIKKNKFYLNRSLANFIIFMLSLFVLNYSPASERVQSIPSSSTSVPSTEIVGKPNGNTNNNTNNNNNSSNNTVNSEINSIDELKQAVLKDTKNEKKLITEFISHKKSYLDIYPPFLDKYDYNYDYEFWKNILFNVPSYERGDNRYMEEQMLIRIKEINNNKYDDYLGISYSRTSRVFNLERDFLYQYYSLGIIGLILLAFPIVLVLLYSMLKILLKNDCFNLKNCTFCLSVGLILAISIYSGDVLDNINTNTILGVFTGLLLNNILSKKGEENEN